METKPLSSDALIVSAMCFVAGALLAWSFTFNPNGPDGADIDWPAWVQAVGSVAAIGVAVYVPWRQKADQLLDARSKDKARVIIMAAALYPAVESFRGQCRIVRSILVRPHEERKAIPKEVFARAYEFDQFRTDLLLMGEIGIEINILITRQDDLQIMLKGLRESPVLEKVFLDKASTELEKAERLAERCRGNLQSVFNANRKE